MMRNTGSTSALLFGKFFLSTLLILCMLLPIAPVFGFDTKAEAVYDCPTASEVTARIEAYMNQCRGKYWNAGLSYEEVKALADQGNYLGATTEFPCDTSRHPKGYHDEEGCQSNRFKGLEYNARQCAGFAVYLEYVVFGSLNRSEWNKRETVGSGYQFNVGDLVRYKNSGNLHSVVIARVSADGETVTVAEGNWGGHCRINYGRTMDRSDLIRRLNESGCVWESPAISESYTLDVNGLGDNTLSNDLEGYATFDVYVYGELVADDVTDYYNEHIRKRGSYEIKDIKPGGWKEFLGYSDQRDHSDFVSGGHAGIITDNTECVLAVNSIDPEAYLKRCSPSASMDFNGHNYYLYTEPVTWYAAKIISNYLGGHMYYEGHLATITSEEENRAVLGLIGPDTDAWIGATDKNQEGTFAWDNLDTFDYANWNTGQPDNWSGSNESSENYVHIVAGTNGEWNDTEGCAKFAFVCEVDDFAYHLDYSTGTLTYNSGGDMPDYYAQDGTDLRPWKNDLSSIRHLVIADAVTSISNKAFKDCNMLESVSFGRGLKSIGDRAFSGCSSLEGISIPDGVESIGDNAFASCTSLTSLTIPGSVTSMGEEAFGRCTGLTSVTILEGVTSLWDGMFYYCTNLKSVTIPASVTSIGGLDWFNWNAFVYCSSLTDINVDEHNSVYCSIEGVLFDKSASTLLLYPDGRAGYYCIPASVTNIGEYAFSDCSHLTGVTIPASVTSIGYRAFIHCNDLTSVRLSDSVTSIGDLAFISDNKLTDVYYSGTEGQWASIAMGNNNDNLVYATIHYNWQAGGTLVLPGELRVIESEAFTNLPGVDTVRVPASVTDIADDSFDPSITIKAPAGSYAIAWARNHGVAYQLEY